MILLINAVPIATVLKEIYIKYRFKMDAKTNESIYVRFGARFMIQYISENSIRIVLPVIEQNLNKLVKSGFLRKQGIGRGTTYTVK